MTNESERKNSHEVVVRDLATREVVKVIPCQGERQAERVLRGVLMQMDSSRFIAYDRPAGSTD